MRLISLVQAMTPDEQRGALVALDECTRPMTVREIEKALRQRGHSRSWSETTARKLKGLNIVAIYGDYA